MIHKMKDSGVKWIGETPADWELNKIKYIAVLKGRIGWQGLTSEEYTDEGAYLVTGTDFENGGINWASCVHVPMSRWKEARDIQIENGDLLITKDGTIGKVALVSGCDEPTSLNSGVLRISLADGYDRRFLFWVLQSEVFWSWFTDKNAGNSTIQHLYQGDFAEFKYAVPPLREQRVIANFLDAKCAKLNSIIADLERQIEILQEYKKSVITHVVTKGLNPATPMKNSGIEWIGDIPAHWETKRLKYLGTAQNGLTYEPSDMVFNDGTLVLRSSNIQDGKLDLDDTIYVSCKIPSVIVLQKDDILLCSRNGSRRLIGKCILIDKRTAGETYGAFMCVFRSNHNRFLHYTFQSEIFNYYLATFLTSTVNQLTNANLLSMVVPITFDKKEQDKIVEYLNDFCYKSDDLIKEKKKQLAIMQANKSSIIYEYVTGKKRVKEETIHAD